MKSYCTELFRDAAKIIMEKRKIKVLNVNYYRAIINAYAKLGYFLPTKKKENVHAFGLECLSLDEICSGLFEEGLENPKPKADTIGKRLKRTAPVVIELFKEKYESGELDIEVEMEIESVFKQALVRSFHE